MKALSWIVAGENREKEKENNKKPTLFSVGIWHLQGESNP